MENNLTVAGEIVEAKLQKYLTDEHGNRSEVWSYVIKQNDFGREDTCIPFVAFNPRKKKWPLEVGRNVRVDLNVMGHKKGDYWLLRAQCLKVWVDCNESEYRKYTRRKLSDLDNIPIDIYRDEEGDSPRIDKND